jgi:cation-transporting ATPase 13A2
MREMSRFSCPVTVLDTGAWVTRDSPTLVPGDIIDLSASALTVLPADALLLAGDAIVNESMLTGESVPVSKVPTSDAVLAAWRDGGDVSSEASRSFLYAGTRVVRIRGQVAVDGSLASPALALVVRTGFTTTKGALVRSMLFPKPMGFKFYRDSIRFIMVLTGIAGLGFCVSAVQFVRLGVRTSYFFLIHFVLVLNHPSEHRSLGISSFSARSISSPSSSHPHFLQP